MKAILILAIAVGVAAPVAAARCQRRATEAVVLADRAWGDTEAAGDAAFVENLLLPDYRSIAADGSITSRVSIVERTSRRGKSERFAKELSEYRRGHPTHPAVTIVGDTAVLTWITDGKAPDAARSCDIFVYREGRWRALYSEHTNAGA